MTTSLPFTGERFHPEKSGEMWFEHWHRYRFIAPLVAGKRVLDIACGEGYGSNVLATIARDVGGVDISAGAIAHATETYRRDNLGYQVGACTAIPVGDASIDVLVSFETLEHIREQEDFLSEIKRVLVPNGWAVISTPNKSEYSDARGYTNQFHVKELYREQFATLLTTHFKYVRWVTQRNGFHSMIASEAKQDGVLEPIDASMRIESMPGRAGQIAPPLYYLAFVSNDADVLDALPMTANAFTAFEDNQVDVFMQIWRHSQHLEQKVAHLESQIATHEQTISQLASAPQTVASAVAPAMTDAPTAPAKQESWLESTIKRLSS